jgi:hypothetical protein
MINILATRHAEVREGGLPAGARRRAGGLAVATAHHSRQHIACVQLAHRAPRAATFPSSLPKPFSLPKCRRRPLRRDTHRFANRVMTLDNSLPNAAENLSRGTLQVRRQTRLY